MPRRARIVIPGIPHHVVQRGNRRGNVFFDDDDRIFYLERLNEYCQKWHVDVLAYCLMTNHVHLVLKPETESGLQDVLKPLHMRHSQRINKARNWSGHLWQGRFFSSPLDDAYTWSAIRYVERNPVVAGLVEKAEEYRWSSAAAHCGLTKDPMLLPLPEIGNAIPTNKWADWLAVSGDEQTTRILQRNFEKGIPCGSENFIDRLEKLANRELKYRPQGRPCSNKG